MLLKLLIFNFVLSQVRFYTIAEDKTRISRKYDPKPYKSCFEHLGCIDTSEDWYDETIRPKNLEPLDRHTIRTEFFLIIKSDSEEELNYDTVTAKKESIEASTYKKNENLIFLVHDFTSNGYTGWVKHFSKTLLKTMSINVVSVDWEAGAEPPFDQAIANARVVALEIIVFIDMLKTNFILNEKNVYIIGHGVGAHVAGYVGHSFSGIGKITGLDPTGPQFAGMPEIVRLDPGDAAYVEVLHTDAFNERSQGTREHFGHSDFYINDAKLQPSCNQSKDFPIFTALDRNHLKEGIILPACSHKRAFKYFIEAIDNSECEFTGFHCASYEQFIEGNCTSCTGSNCATFGLKCQKSVNQNFSYFLNTREESPFCMNSYKVTISLEKNPKAKSVQTGNFELLLVDKNDQVSNSSSNDISLKSRKFEHGKKYTFIFYSSPPKILNVKEAKLKWSHSSATVCIMFCNNEVFVDEINISYLSVAEKGPENRLCPLNGITEIQSGSYMQFTDCTEATSKAPTEVTTSKCKKKP